MTRAAWVRQVRLRRHTFGHRRFVARSFALSNSLCDIASVSAHAIDQAGLGGVKPGQSDKEQSRVCGHAARLNRKAIAIDKWKLDHREVKAVAGRPDNVADAVGSQVKRGLDRLREAIAECR